MRMKLCIGVMAVSVALSASAQSVYQSTNATAAYNFPAITGVGPLGLPIQFLSWPTKATDHQIAIIITGPNATTCQLQIEQSADNATWTLSPGITPISCTEPGLVNVPLATPSTYLRVNVTGYTPSFDFRTSTLSSVQVVYDRFQE